MSAQKPNILPNFVERTYHKLLVAMRFELFTAVAILIMLFWVNSPCDLVGRSQRFGEACCLHLQGWSDESEWGTVYVGSVWVCAHNTVQAVNGTHCIWWVAVAWQQKKVHCRHHCCGECRPDPGTSLNCISQIQTKLILKKISIIFKVITFWHPIQTSLFFN
jgi:hypothetical protein